MSSMNVWELYYIPTNDLDVLFRDDLVLISEWYGNEKPTKNMIQEAIDRSNYSGGKFIILTSTEMG